MDAIQEVGEGGKEKATRAKVQPKCLSWYPDRMAWQLNLTRRDIRRVEAYFKLHNFLISETESGTYGLFEFSFFLDAGKALF